MGFGSVALEKSENDVKTITQYRETINDFLLGKINEEKCIRRLRVLTGMSAQETDSLVIKLEERQIIVIESKLTN